MASLSNAWKLGVFYAFLVGNGFVYGLLSPTVNATAVKVGYLWESPRQENVDTSEVVMDKIHLQSILRLICDISPPLPNDEKHWETRNELVKWFKTGPGKAEEVKSMRYWSSDMTKTAISFTNVTLDSLGTYSCKYDDVSASIDILVANVEAAKALKTPDNLTELYTYVSYMKDKSGINGWNERNQLLQPIGTKEYCNPVDHNSHQVVTTVHQLNPSDIKIVAAMGDAFTVGLGARATSVIGYFTEYKDISWSIGGANNLNQTTTIPNVIRQFSPSLKGASAKTSASKENFYADLNMAFTGASASDLEDQAKVLVLKLKAMKDIDYQNDWKLLTIWMGTEDLCQVCREDKFSASSFIKYVMRTLKYLQDEVPRLFVNLVLPMDVSPLHDLHQQDTKSCQILGWNSCPCLKGSDAEKSKIAEAAKQYKNLLEELVNSGLYETKDSFTVVIQPALQEPPKTKDGDLVQSFFGVDCLHFSVHGHAAAALALWKNMLEPLGSKTKQWGDQEILKCPSKNKPYLFTKTNSKAVMSDFTDDGDDDGSSAGFPPTAAVALAVSLTAVVVIVVTLVWRGRKSRRRPEVSRLLYAPGPHKPRI